MRLVVDENIPLAGEAFGALGTVRLLPGRAIEAGAVREADGLLVRSVTRVDASLLEGSAVRFVGSATIGTDHVDEAYLASRGIRFAHAPGSNAGSVVEYVLATLLATAVRLAVPLRGMTVGVVGCGNIGGRLLARLPALGVRVLACDPPLARAAEAAGRPHPFIPLDALLEAADAVTLHVPLTRTGPDATHHLLDRPALARLRPGAWVINTCRGAVASGEALLEALEQGRAGAAVLDVWEHEPQPDPALHARVLLGTPHIAGYSFDGKVLGTVMLYRELVRFLAEPERWDYDAALALAPEDAVRLEAPDPAVGETAWLDGLVRRLYDVRADDARMRPLLALGPAARAALFNRLRRDYPRRRAFERFRLDPAQVPAEWREAVFQGIGIGEGEQV